MREACCILETVYCAKQLVFFSQVFAKVSSNQLICFIFHTGFTLPNLSYYWSHLLFNTENIFIHIFSQLGRSLIMALFKFRMHKNQSNPIFYYTDFLNDRKEVKMPALQIKIDKACPSFVWNELNRIRRNSACCLQWNKS